ncbi:hypothetical protein [Escherichia coli]|nr:hypothetical protein [Escherichia coli]MBY7562705.1 hypothetical protein [Escherichia coli]MDD8921585.1 hypothetical protein [Escherichia coli]
MSIFRIHLDSNKKA